jgi:hypothetical protein
LPGATLESSLGLIAEAGFGDPVRDLREKLESLKNRILF